MALGWNPVLLWFCKAIVALLSQESLGSQDLSSFVCDKSAITSLPHGPGP